jgi:hypothetical protein
MKIDCRRPAALIALLLSLASIPLPTFSAGTTQVFQNAAAPSGGITGLPFDVVSQNIGNGSFLAPAGSLNLNGTLALPRSPIAVSPIAAPAAVPAKAVADQPPAAAIAVPAVLWEAAPDAAGRVAPSISPASSQASAEAAPASVRNQGILRRLASALAAKIGVDPFADGSSPRSSDGDAIPGKLGRKAAAHDPRTLSLSKYILPELPAAPSEVDFSDKVTKWGMMLNDKIGDCTVAACAHQIQQWTAATGKEQTPSDDSILSAYEAVSGYRPEHPETDGGAEVLDVLKYWRKLGIADHKIGAFASVDPSNFDHVRAAVWIFGSAYLGLNLPKSAQKQDVWDVPAGGAIGPGEPGSWGGHAVEVAGYSPKGVFVVTWGALKLMTWDFFKTYCAEAYAIISQDFLADGKTPNNGFDTKTLEDDLKMVTSMKSRDNRD